MDDPTRVPVSRRPRTSLVQRKLRPPPPPEPLLARPRLEQRLAALVERHRVVVVAATAGSGKTTAVLQAAGRLDRPLAWLSVDRTDVAPGRLLTYLEGALSARLPTLAGVASAALAEGIAHPEAAALLVEAVGDVPLVLVLDDLERLGDAPEAWAVVEAVVRYAPAAARVVLVSRRELPPALCALPPGGVSAAMTADALAFTREEAADALRMLGESDVDAAAAVESTGGWVTGVLFEAWRSAGHVAGAGGERDPLDGYLASQILAQLAPEERDFLVATAVLDEVTAERAAALGEPAAGRRLAALRLAHLPAVWDEAGGMRCHPRFREHLLARLERDDARRLAEVRVAHGRLLAREGHAEEATEELLRAGALEAALEPAGVAIFDVVERLDFAVAERWLAALADVAPSGASPLTTAELMLAVATDDYRRGVRVLDQLSQLGERDAFVRSSDRAAAMSANSYLGAGRMRDVHDVLALAEDGPEMEITRYMLALYDGGPPRPRPAPVGGPMDAVLLYADYFRGRLTELAAEPAPGWAHAVAQPWKIAARAALGYTREALALYEAAEHEARVLPVALSGYVGPEVLIDAGRREAAREAIAHAQALGRARGALDLLLLGRLSGVKLLLRLDRDPDAALAEIDRLEREPAARAWPFVAGPLATWHGCALLMRGEDAAAQRQLEHAVELLRDAGLLLDLPAAAAYLAEARWRADEEEAADRAADLALDASRRLGSHHRLLQALADFPAVVARRLDAEPGADSAWHELGRALIAQGLDLGASVADAVELRDFGAPSLLVDGQERRLRIGKSYELLAYLIARRGGSVVREELLDALFGGRADDSARSYLRQAIHWVRRALPEGGLVESDGRMRLDERLSVASDAARFEALLGEAARLQSAARLRATREALALFDRGDYLAGASSSWAEERREQLAARAVEARGEAAELAFVSGRYREARELAEAALRADPLREGTWRLAMRIASALGDDDGVIAAFRRCERALAEIGAAPAPSTRRLLELLRR